MEKMKEITKATQVINDSADNVWERLRKLDGVEEFLPEVVSKSWLIDDQSPGVGTKRSCSLNVMPEDAAPTVEEVIAFDDKNRTYSYRLEDGAMPVKNMVNTFTVKDLGYRKCELSWQATIESFIENPQMSEKEFNEFVVGNGVMLMNNISSLHQ